MRNSITRLKTKSGLKIWAILFWLMVWQLAAMSVGQEILLAAPLQVLRRFFELAGTAAFWEAALYSLTRIFGGFLLGLGAGIGLSALSARFAPVRDLIAPLIQVIRAIPVASFVILALIWVSARNLSVLIVFLIVLPVVYAGTNSEIERVDPQMLEMAKLFHLSRVRQLLYIYLLPALKGLEGICLSAIGLAWKSGTAAELISIPSGSIGERLYKAKIYLMTGEMFAWTILIVLLSAACAQLFIRLLRYIGRRLERM